MNRENFPSTVFLLFFIENTLRRAMHPNAKCLAQASVMSGSQWTLLLDEGIMVMIILYGLDPYSSKTKCQSSQVPGNVPR